jgi:hypothetical protein
MAAYKSYELGVVDGVGAERVENGTFFGRVRRDYFHINSTDEMNGASTAAADTVELARIPKGAIIQDVVIYHEDWGTDVDIDIGLFGTDGDGTYDNAGTADDADFLVADYDLTATVTAKTSILEPALATEPFGYVTTKAVTVKGTIVDGGTISVSADKDMNGYVEYVVD